MYLIISVCPAITCTGNEVAVVDQNTIRHVNCKVFVLNKSSRRCRTCGDYRNTLRAITSRRQNTDPEVRVGQHSKMNDRWRTPSEITEKLSRVKRDFKAARMKIKKLTTCLEKAVQRDGMTVGDPTHDDLVTIMKENSEKVASLYPENSFPRLFWDEQLKAASQKKACSMRWHPLMIRWCLYLRHISGKGYELLRESGCLSLPSPRTLRDYTHYNQTTTGFSAATDKELLDVLKRKNLTEEWQKLVVLLLDEVYIREEVVYNKHTGQILGLLDVGDVNNHLLK